MQPLNGGTLMTTATYRRGHVTREAGDEANEVVRDQLEEVSD